MSFASASRLGIGILLVAAILTHWPATDPQSPGTTLSSVAFPTRLGNWHCQANKNFSDGKSSWNGECSTEAFERATVEVIYLAKQTKDHRLPSVPLSFSGNRLYSERVYLEVQGVRFPVTQMLGQHSDGRNEAMVYWYELEGMSFANEYSLRLATMARRLLGRGTSGLSVRITSPVEAGRSGDTVLRTENNLARDLWTHLRETNYLRTLNVNS